MAIAINGSSNTITGLAVGGLPDGVVDTDMLAANAVTAAKATGSAKGITMAQIWRVHTGYEAATGDNWMTSNWEAADEVSTGNVGSSMSESSGVFTFPSTGIYLINLTVSFYNGTDRRYLGCQIHRTINNSDYYAVGLTYGNIKVGSSTTYTSVPASCMFDVSNTSTHKVKFRTSIEPAGGSGVYAHTDRNNTWASFIRLGDT